MFEITRPGGDIVCWTGNKVKVGDNYQEAVENELKFYIGPLCLKEHKTIGHPNHSLRETHNRKCIHCTIERERSPMVKHYPTVEEDRRKAEARRKAEDLRMAKEYGLDLDDF